MNQCYCGSEKPFSQCCEPFLKGEQLAPTAEALMRSRYSAFCTVNVDYIYQTMSGPALDGNCREETEAFAEAVQWTKLEVINSSVDQADNNRALVEFIAYYNEDGITKRLHEKSQFTKHNDQWLYVDGDHVINANKNDRVGRNDPCPCGSQKKFKKCCL